MRMSEAYQEMLGENMEVENFRIVLYTDLVEKTEEIKKLRTVIQSAWELLGSVLTYPLQDLSAPTLASTQQVTRQPEPDEPQAHNKSQPKLESGGAHHQLASASSTAYATQAAKPPKIGKPRPETPKEKVVIQSASDPRGSVLTHRPQTLSASTQPITQPETYESQTRNKSQTKSRKRSLFKTISSASCLKLPKASGIVAVSQMENRGENHQSKESYDASVTWDAEPPKIEPERPKNNKVIQQQHMITAPTATSIRGNENKGQTITTTAASTMPETQQSPTAKLIIGTADQHHTSAKPSVPTMNIPTEKIAGEETDDFTFPTTLAGVIINQVRTEEMDQSITSGANYATHDVQLAQASGTKVVKPVMMTTDKAQVVQTSALTSVPSNVTGLPQEPGSSSGLVSWVIKTAQAFQPAVSRRKREASDILNATPSPISSWE